MPDRPLVSLWLATFLAASSAAAAPLTAYDDQLRNGFADWSWASRDMAQTAVVHTGTAAISFEPDGWAGLFLHRDLGIDTAVYESLELWVHGGASGGQHVRIALTVGGDPVGNDGALAPCVTGGSLPAGQWAKATIPFASLGVTSGSFDGFWLQDGTGGDQPAVYVDDVRLLERTTPPPPPPLPVSVTVNPDAGRRPISPWIYGVNFGPAAQASRVRWPVRRWGGNSTTRYSWQHDISNRASDWFFYNIENDNPNPAALPHGSSSDRFIDETRAAGGEPLVTVPLIGWTPVDRTRRWGFSVGKYGAQQKTECTETGNAFWCQPDAGNGLHPNGSPITGNDPHDTSREIGPGFVTGWMEHIASRTGAAGAGGVKLFALDNEPMLWNSTHRDVHPSPVTYDEMWQRTRDYAAAMKAEDPAIQILGPSDWGWCAYFFSAADGCSAGADAAAHGNLPFLEWYLEQVRDYELAHGVRLVDYLDVHYYPQGTDIALTGDESAGTAARRLRSLKSLYDPAYVDESWIGQPVRLIPRMRAWIDARLPGAKLAITEYNWGDGGVSSALAQAEALALFGREGVDLATRWVAPAEDSLIEDAFLFYLDYDGAGGTVAGDSVSTVSSNVDLVGAYAVRGTGSRLFLLLFNKDTASRRADVQVAGGLSGSAALYRFGSTGRLAPAGTVPASGSLLSLLLPGRSATLAVVERDSEPPPGADFYTLAPCRVLDTRHPAGSHGGPALAAGAQRTFPLAGRCGIPSTARAVSVNLTVVTPTQTGHLQAYPGGIAPPATSVINFGAGQTRANNAILPLAADGTLAVRPGMASGTVHLILDVNGYFE